MRKGMTAFLLGLGLVFSQAAVSAEMIRYEHDMYQNQNPKNYADKANKSAHAKQAPQGNFEPRQKNHLNDRINKQGHPVHIAFPDRG